MLIIQEWEGSCIYDLMPHNQEWEGPYIYDLRLTIQEPGVTLCLFISIRSHWLLNSFLFYPALIYTYVQVYDQVCLVLQSVSFPYGWWTFRKYVGLPAVTSCQDSYFGNAPHIGSLCNTKHTWIMSWQQREASQPEGASCFPVDIIHVLQVSSIYARVFLDTLYSFFDLFLEEHDQKATL